MKKKLYVKTTKDKYRLPIAVADSAQELSELLGCKKRTVIEKISHGSKTWYKVEVDFEEGEL